MDTMFATCNKLLALFKTRIRSYKNLNKNIAYFLNLITSQSTVVDIGLHDPEYVSFLIKISKYAKNLIAFEGNSDTYNSMCKKAEVLKSNNIVLHQLPYTQTENIESKGAEVSKKKEVFFNFYINPSIDVKQAEFKINLDNYYK